MSSRAVIVGGGVGGLCAAIRLRAAGHEVDLHERNDVVGGKVATYERDGFTFDIGPSLVTLPHVIDEVFRLAGTSIFERLGLVRLDPQFHYHWRDGSSLTVHDDRARTSSSFEEFSPGAGEQWRSFIERGSEIWEVAERTFFAGPMDDPIDLLRRVRSVGDLRSIDSLRTLSDAARSTFDDRRMHQWAGRYATYSGSSPRKVPATLACIAFVEAEFGCWYVTGGLGALRDALASLASEVGVAVHTSSEVVTIATDHDRVIGVELAGGGRADGDVVVVNADAEHLYTDLLPDARRAKRVRRAGRSTSGFVLCLGVDGTTPGIGHHNVWFSGDGPQEFRQLDAGLLADDPTIYGCVSSVTDPTQAPLGCENWFLLVNTPPGAAVDAPTYRDVVLGSLADRGIDLRGRVRFAARMTPSDIERVYRAPAGAIYGTSSNGRMAAFARPANRGPVAGLYLVGGSSHPGGGLPLVATSARIVADLVAADQP